MKKQLCIIIKKTFPENCTALHCPDFIIAIVLLGRAIQRLILAKTIHLRVGVVLLLWPSPCLIAFSISYSNEGLSIFQSEKKNNAAINFNSMEWSLFLIIHYLASLNIWLANGSSEILTGYFSQFKIEIIIQRRTRLRFLTDEY